MSVVFLHFGEFSIDFRNLCRHSFYDPQKFCTLSFWYDVFKHLPLSLVSKLPSSKFLRFVFVGVFIGHTKVFAFSLVLYIKVVSFPLLEYFFLFCCFCWSIHLLFGNVIIFRVVSFLCSSVNFLHSRSVSYINDGWEYSRRWHIDNLNTPPFVTWYLQWQPTCPDKQYLLLLIAPCMRILFPWQKTTQRMRRKMWVKSKYLLFST